MTPTTKILFKTEKLPDNFSTQVSFDVVSIEYHLLDDEQTLKVMGIEEVFSGFMLFAINPN